MLTLMLLPVFGLLFMIGFMLSYYGEKTNHAEQVKNKPKTSAPLYDFEMHVIEQAEKQTIEH
jgi:hypothetical protein